MDDLAKLFHVLVLAADDYQPQLSGSIELLYTPIPDGELTTRQRRSVEEVGRHLAKLIRHRKHVLVTCAMGINRSALLAALALRCGGMTAEQAITQLRIMRGPDLLCNRHFVRIVREFKPERPSYMPGPVT